MAEQMSSTNKARLFVVDTVWVKDQRDKILKSRWAKDLIQHVSCFIVAYILILLWGD